MKRRCTLTLNSGEYSNLYFMTYFRSVKLPLTSQMCGSIWHIFMLSKSSMWQLFRWWEFLIDFAKCWNNGLLSKNVPLAFRGDVNIYFFPCSMRIVCGSSSNITMLRCYCTWHEPTSKLAKWRNVNKCCSRCVIPAFLITVSVFLWFELIIYSWRWVCIRA